MTNREPRVALTIRPGTSVHQACVLGQTLADKLEEPVLFTFNDVECVAVVGGSAEQLATRQQEEQARTPRVYSDE